MAQLSAFVGHSFLDTDQEVVGRLLKLLTSISTLMPNFQWDHALSAEPKLLSDKVKEKMRGKNLFIGICTAKENTVEPTNLRASYLPWSASVIASKQHVQLKTSDWILQEIGMAVGRDMNIILLLESGLRVPGGLQGDLEYIAFNRARPEECHNKLADMIRSLSPADPHSTDAQQQAPVIAASTAPESQTETKEEEQHANYFIPDISWKAATYCTRLSLAISLGDKEAEDAIAKSFSNSAFATDPQSQAAFQASAISARARAHKGEWVAPLHSLSQQFPKCSGAYRAMGIHYDLASDHQKSADNFELAAQFSPSIKNQFTFLVLSAEQSRKSNAPDRAVSLIAKASALVSGNETIEADCMVRLATYWKDEGNNILYSACAERALELSPDNIEARFDLAYKYSEINMERHALFHYRQRLIVAPDGGSWNNFGVSAGLLKLPVTSIQAYRMAETGGSSLAKGNLAHELLDAGFLSEASAICSDGLKDPEPDPRLLDAKVRCERVLKDEGEAEKTHLEQTTVRRSILRNVGHQSICERPRKLAQIWQGPRCHFMVTLTQSTLTLTGSYTETVQGNLLALIGGDNRETVKQYSLEYVGILVGRSFVGRVKLSSEAGLGTLMGFDEGRECIGYLHDSLAIFELLEGDKDRVTLAAIAKG